MKWPIKIAIATVALAVLAGCVSTPSVQRDATLTLIRHPEFPAAAKAAPGWVDAALKQITAYERELRAKEASQR